MDDRSESVQSIIEQCQTGSSREDAFRRLFDLYSPRLFHFFARRGFPHQDCLDLTQETFIGIYKGIASFRRDARFETWLFSIAANAFRKRLRWGAAGKREGHEVSLHAARNGEEGRPVEAAIVADTPAPSEETLRKERSRVLREAIGKLPEQMRKCLLLRVDRDLTYREIALLLRLSPETVKVHLFQARRRLQADLGPYFEDSVARLEEAV